MGWRIAVAAFAVLLCGAAPDDHPVLRPVHDVDVIYVLSVPRPDAAGPNAGGRDATGPDAGGPVASSQDTGGGATLHERLRWNAAAQTLRVDPPTAGLFVIIDLAARRMSTVRTADKTVIEMAAPDNVTGMPDAAAADAVRRGEDTVAGLACTEWDMTDAAGEAARLCLTADGVLLRARSGGRTLLSAETVQYGPLNADLFRVPTGYTRRWLGPQPARPQPAGPQTPSPQ
ncbi:MAG TPA: hypothetical protein VFE41_33515 [Acetobacteraceae bacterium]|jgi:hypothetical protein|nr:hypothetical protein [Acetobacteraceae bacterium]